MKSIKLINPENALRILNDCSLTTKSDNISVSNDNNVSLIFNSERYNNENFGDTLRIGLAGGGYFGVRNAYIEISLDKFDDNIELELIELKYGIALSINCVFVYYKIKYKTFEEICNLTNLRVLDLSGWTDLNSLKPICHLDQIEAFKLTLGRENENGEIEDAQFDFESIKYFSNLMSLDLSVNSTANLNSLTSLLNLEAFSLFFYDGWGDEETFLENPIDLDFIHVMKNLKRLETYKLRRISDVSFLNSLLNLEELILNSPYALREITLNKTLLNFKKIQLTAPVNLESIEFLSFTPNLQFLLIENNEKIISIDNISQLNQLRYLTLDNCSGIKSYQSISNSLFIETLSLVNYQLKFLDIDFSRLITLKHLNIFTSMQITNLGNINMATNLESIDIGGCDKLVQLSSIEKLTNLNKVSANLSPNIRNLDRLSNCLNLRELEIDDLVNAIQILMACAFSRKDEKFIQENVFKWIDYVELSKDSNLFTSRLLNCVGLCIAEMFHPLSLICLAMRSRGLQSEVLNDLDAYVWEKWCNLVLDLEKDLAISCLIDAMKEFDVVRETEVILGPIILATSTIIEKYPEEKENLIKLVNNQLSQLEGYIEEQRQIAPSAAVFFASINRNEKVLFWLQKATDEKFPLWKERVLTALVKHYANQENFFEARRLLQEMNVQDEIDKAIDFLAQAMSIKFPVDAGFLLDEIKDVSIRTNTAQTLLSQPSMLSEPQSIYQLLLHLQSNTEELASTLEKIIEFDTTGKVVNSVKLLFITPQETEPSATILLELCKHPSISEFVKPRALEKYKNQLQDRVNKELVISVPLLIADMKEADLLEEDEALELYEILRAK